MADQHRDRRIDEAGEESFPASDPPTFTRTNGAHGRRDRKQPDQDQRRTAAAEQVERARDPHGAGPAQTADQDEPKASPTPDRQRAETTIERVKKPD